jgi:mannose-1-phosphate guanylyltransferase
MKDLAVVIMAGGAGTRFWPASTSERPKQFLELWQDRSLLGLAFDRIRDLVPPERVLVLTNARYAGLVAEQLPELPQGNIICEPFRRDTAAAVALGALILHQRLGDPVMAVLTADHRIEPVDVFLRTLLSAARAARDSSALYTFGIPPTAPETGYGYLERGDEVLADPDCVHYTLRRFHEKPDAPTAEDYVASGTHFWNSGMFVWSVSAILKRFRAQLPGHFASLEPAMDALDTPGWDDALARAFEPLERVSIDFGIMEKAPDVRMVAAGFSWSDVGGWNALAEFLPHDDDGNAFRGRLIASDSRGNIVFSQDPNETVALLGVENCIVIRAGKHTLVVPRHRAQEVKKLVEKWKV